MSLEIQYKSKGYLESLQKHIKARLKQKGSEQTGDALLEHDKYLASASYQIESIIDISGIIVAYPFYIMAMSHLQDGTPMHEIQGSTFEQLGSLSAFVGVMCGVSFTSAAGIPIKEILNTQERERKLNMLGRMYKHILRALVFDQLNTQSISIVEIQSNLDEEIRQTQAVLDNMAIFIEQKKALSASSAYSNNYEERQRNEDEIFEDTRTQLIYQERIKFLKELKMSVSKAIDPNSRKTACEKLSKKIEDKKYASSRDILVELHRPAYESIPFDDKVFAHAQPIRADGTDAEILNNYGVPAARAHYQKLMELISKIVVYKNNKINLNTFKNIGNSYLKGTHLEGFFTNSDAEKYVQQLFTSAQTIPTDPRGFEAIKNDIAKKKQELVPYEDIFKNYGIRHSTSHYAILIDLIENLFAHKHPGNNHAHWIVLGNHHLKGTVLENFFKNPNAPHLRALFARADKQYEHYRAKRATDTLNIDGEVDPDDHTTHTMKQKIHAEDLARDIERKKEEIKFYENQLRIINPVADAIDPWTFKDLAMDSNDVETNNNAPALTTTTSSSPLAPEPTHLALQDPYSTQLMDRIHMLWAQGADLREKVGNFFKSLLRVNTPNDALWHENEKAAGRKDLHFSERTFGFLHRNIAYPFQALLVKVLPSAIEHFTNASNIYQNPIKILGTFTIVPIALTLLVVLSPIYAIGFLTYKLTWAILNFPTLLKTLKGSVDTLHIGVRNFQEGLNVTPNDNVFKHLFYPIIKAVSVPLVGIFELGFGLAYWVIGPFGKDNTVRKISRAINSQYHAQLVEQLCDWMDEKSDNWIILGLDFNSVKYLGMLIVYPSILVNGALNWVYTIVERLAFSIPVVATFAGLVSYDSKQAIKNHQISRRKGWEFSATVGTNMLILAHKFFAQPFKNNWSWLGTAYKELDKKYEMNYYGNLGVYQGFVKGVHRIIVLPSMMIYATIANFFIGIGFTLASLVGFAPLLTFVSFTTSTIAAGVTLPLGLAPITVNAEVGASLLTVPMALEPLNSTHDLYNNAAYEEFQRENIKLKEPIQKYRKYIREYFKAQLGDLKDKTTTAYQVALILLEQKAYQLMPRVPLNKIDVEIQLKHLITQQDITKAIAKANSITENLDKIESYLKTKLTGNANSLQYMLTFISLTKYAREKLFELEEVNENSLATILTDKIISKASDDNSHYITNTVINKRLPMENSRELYQDSVIDDLKEKFATLGIQSIAYQYAKTILVFNGSKTDHPIQACITKGISVETIEHVFKQAKSFESALLESQSPDLFTAMKLKKHNNRTQWSTACIEYAIYTRRGEKKCEDDEALKAKVDALGNGEEDYKAFLAQALANQFAGNTNSRDAHIEYFKNNPTIEQAVKYFYDQYKVKDINSPAKHNAFFGFCELIVNRFIKIMADDRYRRSLENNSKADVKQIYYINDSGAALPCETSIDSATGVLTVSFDGKSIGFSPKSFSANFMQNSVWLNDRYTAHASGNINTNELDPTRFIYSEPNNHVDLDLCLTALKKDFGDEVVLNNTSEKSKKSNENISVEPKLTSTAMPMINWCKYSTSSPSAAHIEQTYKLRATA